MIYRWFYTLILTLIAPFLLYSLYRKRPGKPAFGKRWKEHFGFTPKIEGSRPIWIHAVSVGESLAAIPVIKKLKALDPEQVILVTTTTSTGAKQVEALEDLVVHRYMPIDFSWCIKGFLKAVDAKQLLIMETELWPNTLYQVAKADIPITVLNARLSERSCLRYAKFKGFFNLLSSHLTQVLCQYPSDAERFIRLGLQRSKVHSTGSIKFDITIPEESLASGTQLRKQIGQKRPVWIAASTHQGEDEVVLSAHKKLLLSHPEAMLIIVPRHPERFKQVTQLSQKQGFATVTRTSGDTVVANTSVYIGDTMGEMLALMTSADICFVGGSLLGDKVGGHNLLEPAALKLPILNGPSYYNFAEITQQLIAKSAVSICQNSDDIARNICALIDDSSLRNQKGQAAYHIVEENRGALDRTVAYITKSPMSTSTL